MTRAQAVELEFTEDAAANRRILNRALADPDGGTLRLPAGTYPLDRGVQIGPGRHLIGADRAGGPVGTWLTSTCPDGTPILHVLGSGVTITDLGLVPAPCEPDRHAGDSGTAITVGRYLYPGPAEWIESIELRGVRVRRTGGQTANCIAIMGAVRQVTIVDTTIDGGGTGVAVHWGAVGSGVHSITGPSYHPHRLLISDLRVTDAYEGFYLSSVHDVEVSQVCLTGVEIGFRLLAGDNTDRFHPAAINMVGSRIWIRDVDIAWSGTLYAIRAAGWGRSEIDGSVRTLAYRDVTIEDVTIQDWAGGDWAGGGRTPIVVEDATGVLMRNIGVSDQTSTSSSVVTSSSSPASIST